MGGISVAADKSRANLKVVVQDEESKQPIRCWVEIWGHYPQTELPKGEHTFKNMSLTSGTPGTKDFLDGWAIKIFSGPDGDPDAKIFKWPDVDTVLKPEGGKTHTKVCFVKGPRAALKVEVRKQDGSAFPDGATVIVGGAPRGKTDKDGDLLIPDAPLGETTVRIQAKGWGEVPEAVVRTTPADEVVRKVKVEASGSTTLKVSLVHYDQPTGIAGRLRGTHGLRVPSLTRPENVIERSSKEKKFEDNSPVVLIRGCGTVTLEAFGKASIGAKDIKAQRCLGMTWTIKRRDGEAAPLPSFVPKDGGARAELAGDVGGSFSITASRAGAPDLVWNVLFVAVELVFSQALAKSENFADDFDPTDKTTVGFRSGEFGFGKGKWAFWAKASVKMTGWDGAAAGLDRVEVRILQNGVADDVTARYEDGDKAVEVPRGGLPIVDCNPYTTKMKVEKKKVKFFVQPPTTTYPATGPWADLKDTPDAPESKHQGVVPPFILTDDSFKVSPDQKSALREVETLDAPAGGFDVEHFFSKKNIVEIEGTMSFRTAVATISLDAPHTILVHASLSWRAFFKGKAKDPIVGNAKFTPNGCSASTDIGFTAVNPAQPTLGTEATQAGFETVEPRYNGSCQILWTPGGLRG